MYVGGGDGTEPNASYTIFCYDPVKNLWTFPVDIQCRYFTMTTLNNKLLTAGGQDRSNKTTNQVLTMNAGHLNNYTKMTTARLGAVAVGHQGMLIITGGNDNQGKKLSSTELFDSNNGQWYTCNDLPKPLNWPKLVILDNVLYLLGGNSIDGDSMAVFTAPLDTLSRHQLKWNIYQDNPRHHPSPIIVNSTHLLIIGGYEEIRNEFVYNSDIYKLNKLNQSWESIGNIPSPRVSLAAVSTADNEIIVVGGRDEKRMNTNTVWIGSFEPQ